MSTKMIPLTLSSIDYIFCKQLMLSFWFIFGPLNLDLTKKIEAKVKAESLNK